MIHQAVLLKLLDTLLHYHGKYAILYTVNREWRGILLHHISDLFYHDLTVVSSRFFYIGGDFPRFFSAAKDGLIHPDEAVFFLLQSVV